MTLPDPLKSQHRYIPNAAVDVKEMLQTIGIDSIDRLFESIPNDVKLDRLLDIPGPWSEIESRRYFRALAARNKSGVDHVSFLGAGAYAHYQPACIDQLLLRAEFLTSYTPDQPEVSPGTLQAIFEYPTHQCLPTAPDVANASLYDGSTALCEAVLLTERMAKKRHKVVIAKSVHPQYTETVRTYVQNLGYDIVEFQEGFLEQIPIESKSVDLVTSNCVVNLSPDKPRVFAEIWRVLKDHGRILISDIVSETPVPPHLKVNPQLWGECLVGALTQEEFIAALERAGFYGIEILKKMYWKDVEGYPFFSVTVRGWKFEKTSGCVFKGHRAVYLGPAKAFIDEEGHQFPRNEAYEVCTDTVAKLSNPPYKGMFAILEPGEERAGFACCGPEGCC